jgi:hypothetical protein
MAHFRITLRRREAAIFRIPLGQRWFPWRPLSRLPDLIRQNVVVHSGAESPN